MPDSVERFGRPASPMSLPPLAAQNAVVPGHNHFCKTQGEWFEYKAPSAGFIVSQLAAPGAIYARFQEEPGANILTKLEYLPGLNGVVYLCKPGLWHIYSAITGSAAAVECYNFRPVCADAALLYYKLHGFADRVDVTRWGGTLIQAAGDFGSIAADEDVIVPWMRAALTALDESAAAGSRNVPVIARSHTGSNFVSTLRGLLTTARVTLHSTGADQVIWTGTAPSSAHGEGHAAQIWGRVLATLMGRDTGDSTMRAIEARAVSSSALATGLYRALVAAALQLFDNGTTNFEAARADLASNIGNGRVPTSVRGLWANALVCKNDVDGTLVTPTEMNRSVNGSATNPAAGAVIATLDCRALKDKNVWVTVTVDAATVRADVSYNGTTWRPLETMVNNALSAGVFLTQGAKENAKAFRYLRVVNVDAEAGGAIVEADISAQGG